jgi:uncharacterized protein (TIGR03067 family)
MTPHVLLALAMTLGAPALKDPPKNALKLTGEWVVESQITYGRPIKSSIERRYSFGDDGKWTLTTKGKVLGSDRTYAIDAGKKPAAIDMKYSASVTYTGIIKVEGDTMTLCYSRNADERPKTFESPENSTVILIVLKRVKKE